MTLIGVIMGEFLTSKAGIGYLILYGSQVFNINLVITGVVLLALLSYIMYEIIYLISLIPSILEKYFSKSDLGISYLDEQR